IVEGGFSLAINVALFKPYVNNDTKKIDAIMSASKKIFFKIGFAFVLIGLVLAIIYPLFIKSNLDYLTIFLIFLMVIMSTAFNLLFVIKSSIMFQVAQKEYIYTFFGTLVNLLASVVTIILVYNKVDMLLVRLSLLIFSIINGSTVLILYKKMFPNISTKEKPDYEAIKGTKDIMVQKLTSVIYLSSPLLFISTFISTKMGSVYAVYSSIYNIVKNFLTSMIAAPINGFGQLISDKKYDYVYDKFETYEYIVILTTSILVSAVLIVIIPFIGLYTRSVTDINYTNFIIAVMLASILYLEVIHVPSGNIINVSGNFKVARKIQTITCLVLVSLLSILGYLYGIYGILGATIITNIGLASMEIYYTHIKIFKKELISFIKKLVVNLFLVILLVIMGTSLLTSIDSYLMFFIIGFLTLLCCLIIIGLVNLLLFKNDLNKIFNLFKEMLGKFICKEKYGRV
ncbi:MAG: hypothetical protein PHD02_04545, partial [Bacilli bacterium]|nr:hypothetical protein [Bacilli bacterium]